MNLIKRKYIMSLLFDLVLLLVGGGLLYRLSLNVLTDSSLNNLTFVIINAVVLGAVLLDIVVEAFMYASLRRVVIAFNNIDE
jgi:hypothetical protein